VVIFQENVSFDHYFGTYPNAKNPPGEYKFSPLSDTPSINGLTIGLLTNNTNLADPWRLDKSQVVTVASCDPNHSYTALQKEMDGGLRDKFVQNSALSIQHCDPKLVMGYFDGNTVTALWNYAQHFAMSDNFHSSNIDPSLPGAINLVTGQTHGAVPSNVLLNITHDNHDLTYHQVVNGTSIGDVDSNYDDCSSSQQNTISMTGKNIGNLMD
jgi:phospholipase C